MRNRHSIPAPDGTSFLNRSSLLRVQMRKLRPVLEDAVAGIRTPAPSFPSLSLTFPLPPPLLRLCPKGIWEKWKGQPKPQELVTAKLRAILMPACGLALITSTAQATGRPRAPARGWLACCSGPHGAFPHRACSLGLPIGLQSPLLPQSNKGPNPLASSRAVSLPPSRVILSCRESAPPEQWPFTCTQDSLFPWTRDRVSFGRCSRILPGTRQYLLLRAGLQHEASQSLKPDPPPGQHPGTHVCAGTHPGPNREASLRLSIHGYRAHSRPLMLWGPGVSPKPDLRTATVMGMPPHGPATLGATLRRDSWWGS